MQPCHFTPDFRACRPNSLWCAKGGIFRGIMTSEKFEPPPVGVPNPLVHPAGTGGSVCIVEASRICHSRPEISGPAFLARVGHRQSMTTDRQSKGRRSDAGTQGFTDSIVV